jgi:hypothetical protein
VVVRRKEDGQLFFAPSTWKDAAGNLLEDRSFETALGPTARARSRLGGPPPARRMELAPGRERRRDGDQNQRPHEPTPEPEPAETPDTDSGDTGDD